MSSLFDKGVDVEIEDDEAYEENEEDQCDDTQTDGDDTSEPSAEDVMHEISTVGAVCMPSTSGSAQFDKTDKSAFIQAYRSAVDSYKASHFPNTVTNNKRTATTDRQQQDENKQSGQKRKRTAAPIDANGTRSISQTHKTVTTQKQDTSVPIAVQRKKTHKIKFSAPTLSDNGAMNGVEEIDELEVEVMDDSANRRVSKLQKSTRQQPSGESEPEAHQTGDSYYNADYGYDVNHYGYDNHNANPYQYHYYNYHQPYQTAATQSGFDYGTTQVGRQPPAPPLPAAILEDEDLANLVLGWYYAGYHTGVLEAKRQLGGK